MLRVIEQLILDKPEMTLPEISTVVGIKRHTIETGVRERMALSFRGWHLALVMRNSAEVLRNSNSPIKVVASNFGYGSTRAFSHAFKQCFGMSPVAYRQLPFNPSGRKSSRTMTFSSTNMNQFLLQSRAAGTRLLPIKSGKFTSRKAKSSNR